MLAFIDSPVQLLVAAVVILLIFGPQRLPDIFHQLGRGMRELKKATSEFSSALNTDDTFDHGSTQRYDSYSNSYTNSYSPSDYAPPGTLDEVPALTAAPSGSAPAQESPHGDFMSSALADAAEDYGVASPTDGK